MKEGMTPDEWYDIRDEWAELLNCAPEEVHPGLVWFWKLPREIKLTDDDIRRGQKIAKELGLDRNPAD